MSGRQGRTGVEPILTVDTLPYVDEHAIRIAAPREAVWSALERYANTSLGLATGNPLRAILGTRPPRGFEVSESVPLKRLTLTGQHRFARYLLRFEISGTNDEGTELRAQTFACFPGILGGLYRAAIIGTGAHVLATNHLLRAVRP